MPSDRETRALKEAWSKLSNENSFSLKEAQNLYHMIEKTIEKNDNLLADFEESIEEHIQNLNLIADGQSEDLTSEEIRGAFQAYNYLYDLLQKAIRPLKKEVEAAKVAIAHEKGEDIAGYF